MRVGVQLEVVGLLLQPRVLAPNTGRHRVLPQERPCEVRFTPWLPDCAAVDGERVSITALSKCNNIRVQKPSSHYSIIPLATARPYIKGQAPGGHQIDGEKLGRATKYCSLRWFAGSLASS